MRKSLLELHREFLPIAVTALSNNAVNYVTISSSVTRYLSVAEMKEVETYVWESSFKINVDNTGITLHQLADDVKLEKMESKLSLLKEMINEFIKEGKLRHRNRKIDYPPINRKEWLNGEDTSSGYTGYCFYSLETDGSGKFYMADCHRTINLMLFSRDSFTYPGKTNDYSKSLFKTLEAIVKGINTWKNKRKRLVKRYDKWEERNENKKEG